MAFDWGGALNWTGDNGMGLLAGASTAANLGSGIYSAMAKAAEQRRLESLMKAGPNVSQYYAPMSAAEAAGFQRGAMSNYQQAVPPGAYLDALMGENMATRESQRYQQAQQMAYNDWVQRLGGRQFAAGQQPGMPQNIGAPLAQWMLLRQINAARGRAQQPASAAADMSAYGAAINPAGARAPQYDLYGNTGQFSPAAQSMAPWFKTFDDVGTGPEP